MSVSENFSSFCSNLTVNNTSDISSRYKLITRRLNLDFRNLNSDISYSRYVGSYGRGTAVRGFSDLDMIYELPWSIFSQYNDYVGNGQSALLQAVRRSILKTYPATSIGGDGQVVVVSFSDGMRFEVVPAFRFNLDNRKDFYYPDSNGGGSWKSTDPVPEINALQTRDIYVNGNLKRLCRMARAWKSFCNVPMGGLLIDTLAYRFLGTWAHRDKSYVYYDWMSRDFFDYLASESTEKQYWQALGSGQYIWKKGDFQYKARRACNISKQAIEAEGKGYTSTSKKHWREVYGYRFPS